MLIYHPAQDAYNCVFRMLIALERAQEIERDKLRILDFYIAFPSALASVKWPNSMRDARSSAKLQDNPYRRPVSSTDAFRSMYQLQASSLRCLAASDLIDGPSLQIGLVRRTDVKLGDALRQRIDQFSETHSELLFLVLDKLSSITLLGRDGLKDRTSLMEFRYDPA